MSGKILVTTRSFRKITGPHQQILVDAGFELVNSPFDRAATASELAELLEDVDGAILGLDTCNAIALQNAGRLKVISRFGVGLDSVDLAAATAAGVVVTNTPGANNIAVAEHTLALLLALAKGITRKDRDMREGVWQPQIGIELGGSRLGLIGCGRIGRDVAVRVAAFDMEIVVYDPFPPPKEFMESVGATSSDLADLLATCDFVSLHLPLTDDTRNMIDEKRLSLMKQSACLVNTARGGLVDEHALFDALNAGRIAGAAFDVFLEEPPTGSPLLELDNFIATPHSASSTRQTTLRMGMMAAENALAVLNGERPQYVVNPDVYDHI